VGTLVTLWPTMLRTRIAAGSERAAHRAFPVLVVAILVTAGGALAGQQLVTSLGIVGYLAGLAMVAEPFVSAARGKPPASYPTWSILAGLMWWVGAMVVLAIGVAIAPSWDAVGVQVGWLATFLAAGFGAQVLLGALSYLVPMALGGGPAPVRAANAVLDKGGALRVVVVNAALLVCALPVPGIVRVLCSVLVLGGLAAFIPLLFLAIRASRVAKTSVADVVTSAPAGPRQPMRPDGDRPRGQVTGLAATGVAAVVLAVALGVAIDPTSVAGARASRASAAGVAATGEITTVTVEARDMRFTPSTIEVPSGNRLVIALTNTDDQDVHDLVLDSGDESGRLSPGESKRMDLGVLGRDMEGWCSVLGHRQMGMVLTVKVRGRVAPAASGHSQHAHGPSASRPSEPSAAEQLDLRTAPGAGFTAREATLPPLTDQRVHRRTFTVSELDREVAPGVTQRLWTFNGTAPGPVLHGRVGDVFEISLVNDGTVGHSIDFHAGSLAPDRPMRTIAPGKSLVYRFQATKAGVWMYHCSTMPMSAHIANGLFGAVVIEPAGLRKVDRSYVLVQSELYLGPQKGPVDMAKLQAEHPDAVVFNGYANQYDHRPFRAKVGERLRIWVLDAGPNRSTSFHVVGGQFDTVYAEGAYLLEQGEGGSQALALGPAQGGFVELAFRETGHYPFVSHVMVDAERGAHGVIQVTR
jgi:nitrite reductase (NO-forming)